jgi:hypothetical protein
VPLRGLAISLFLLAGLGSPASALAKPTSLELPQMSTMVMVKCFSGTRCVGVGSKSGEGNKAVVFDPLTASVYGSVVLGGSYIENASCPVLTQCTGVNARGQAITFNPTGPAGQYFAHGVGDIPNVGISCPTIAQCTVLSTRNGDIASFDPRAPGQPTSTRLSEPLGGLICVTASLCVAKSSSESLATFNPATPANRASFDAFPNDESGALFVCPAANQCTAMSGRGSVVTFDPGAPSGTPVPVISAGADLACGSVNRCVALTTQSVTSFDPRNPSGAKTTQIASYGAIACLRENRCFVYAGRESTGITSLTPFDPAAQNDPLPTPSRLTVTSTTPVRLTSALRGVKQGARVKAELIKGKKVLRKVALRAGDEGSVVWKLGMLRAGSYRVRLTAGKVVRTTSVTVTAGPR